MRLGYPGRQRRSRKRSGGEWNSSRQTPAIGKRESRRQRGVPKSSAVGENRAQQWQPGGGGKRAGLDLESGNSRRCERRKRAKSANEQRSGKSEKSGAAAGSRQGKGEKQRNPRSTAKGERREAGGLRERLWRKRRKWRRRNRLRFSGSINSGDVGTNGRIRREKSKSRRGITGMIPLFKFCEAGIWPILVGKNLAWPGGGKR